MKSTQLKTSLESIDFQYKMTFKKRFTAAIAPLMGTKVTNTDIKKAKLVDIISDELGLKVAFKLVEDFKNAAVEIPDLVKSNPLLTDIRMNMERDSEKLLSKAKFITGTVDLKNSKVHGVYSEVISTIYIDPAFFNGPMKFTGDEIAAILTHELGHLMTYFEMITRTTYTNYVIQNTVNRLVETSSVPERAVIVQDIEDSLALQKGSLKSLVDGGKKAKSTSQVIILNEARNASRSMVGADIYSVRAFEQLSDQFAALQGFSVPLATGLDKLNRSHISRHSVPRVLHWIMQAIKFVLWVGSWLSLQPQLVFMAAIVLLQNPLEEVYDGPNRRITQIRKTLVDGLKGENLPKELRDSLLKDIDEVDDLLRNVKERETFYSFMWRKVLPWGRKTTTAQDFQQDLEDLLRNELFVSAKRLQQLV